MQLKSVLITGCSAGGIGFALAQEFQKRNLHVFATARDPSKMSQLDKRPNVTLISLDVTSLDSVQKAVGIVRTHTGGTLDYLVNNAGQTLIMPVLDFDIETAKAMYDINMWGMVRVTQEFAPLLIAAKGTLVSISSVCTSLVIPWMGESTSTRDRLRLLNNILGIYLGSKAAMTATTEALRLELAPFGVTVLTVNTGAIRTNGVADAVNFKLPPLSRYKSIEKQVAAAARGEHGPPQMEASVYAVQVVDDVLRGCRGQIWRGGYAWVVRWVLSRLPSSVAVSRAQSSRDEVSLLMLSLGLDLRTEKRFGRHVATSSLLTSLWVQIDQEM